MVPVARYRRKAVVHIVRSRETKDRAPAPELYVGPMGDNSRGVPLGHLLIFRNTKNKAINKEKFNFLLI